MSVPIPAAHSETFVDGVVHPSLYLWDAWSYRDGEITNLYCLAVSRYDSFGRPIMPAGRNHWPFHVRHFISRDNGKTWRDEGCFQEPRIGSGLFDSRSIWSGSITPLPGGEVLVAYTGIRESEPDLIFQQSIGLALSQDGSRADRLFDEPVSCCQRDWQSITDRGYYLDKPARIGHRGGEAGGPISAWRDPFVYVEGDCIHLFWGAKADSHVPALAHATLRESGDGFVIDELFKPVTMPDGEKFTQLELPKVLHDRARGTYYLLISTCNRLYEGQTDAEVDKKVRLYSSASLHGPWVINGSNGSALLPGDSHMFGVTVLDADFENAQLHCVAPYTDAADDKLSLTLSNTFSIPLPRLLS